MKKEAIAITICTSALFILSGCTAKSDTQSSTGYISKFSADGDTVSSKDAWIIDNASSSSDTEQGNDVEIQNGAVSPEDIEHYYGELDIVEDSDNVDWEVSGDSIIYNGITFVDLNYIANKLEMPCSPNSLISFVVHGFEDSTSSSIDLIYTIDSEMADDGDGTLIPADYELSYNSDYVAIKSKYNNTPVDWTLIVNDVQAGKRGTLYGCSEYIIYYGNNELITVATSELSPSPEEYTESDNSTDEQFDSSNESETNTPSTESASEDEPETTETEQRAADESDESGATE